ncbi:YceI family protein [Hyalangium rubrum]|uniref:YceI family protein n=1 Tax=Hyalangium rubrum TaxID=3103134 RepID=A0ABU5HI44_9BACT|nr:YceI family protein [Hyalangium sp. s54d21]MDY7233021.1 YceI family protein [Hyalangium sp. s54d21]
MKTLLKSVVAAAVLAAPSLALAAAWEIDPAHSGAQFSVKHMMVSNVKGEFGKLAGTFNIDEKDITKSTVDVTIDATTINTRNEQRDNHLRSPDFFDVKNHPNITFKSTKVEKGADGKLKVTGNLTLHGVTKPVVLDVEGPTPEVKSPFGDTRIGASATTTLNRKDFGLNWNKAIETGGVVVGDEVRVSIDLEGVKKAPAAAPAAPVKK